MTVEVSSKNIASRAFLFSPWAHPIDNNNKRYYSDRKLGEFTVGKTNLLYVAYGEVRAGVDLEALETADVTTSETGDTEITLTLPSPERRLAVPSPEAGRGSSTRRVTRRVEQQRFRVLFSARV